MNHVGIEKSVNGAKSSTLLLSHQNQENANPYQLSPSLQLKKRLKTQEKNGSKGDCKET